MATTKYQILSPDPESPITFLSSLEIISKYAKRTILLHLNVVSLTKLLYCFMRLKYWLSTQPVQRTHCCNAARGDDTQPNLPLATPPPPPNPLKPTPLHRPTQPYYPMTRRNVSEAPQEDLGGQISLC